MYRIGFYFLSAFVLCLACLPGFQSMSLQWQLLVPLACIIFFGVPHGAIDHLIFFEGKTKLTDIKVFIGYYLVVMTINLVLWLFFPFASLLFFFFLSAFHFGQSQFSQLIQGRNWSHYALYFFWGCSIITGLLFYNHLEIEAQSMFWSDMPYFHTFFEDDVLFFLLISTSIITLLLLIYLLIREEMSLDAFFFEIYLILAIHLSFYLLPVFIGFTLYFVVLHAFRVLEQEFLYLKAKSVNKDLCLKGFIKLLAPLSLISFVGIGFLVYLVHMEVVIVSEALLGFIIISMLTLPHSFVMEKFYRKFR